MCGIVGVVGPIGEAHHRVVHEMSAAIAHRGPDEAGYHVGDGVVFGVRRLSVIDVAHGQQPVHDGSNQVVGILNGEIYNYPELQRWLRSRGHRLESESDSACIPGLYLEYGPEYVRHLRGMFATAIWDTRDRSLHLSRDRVGKKPLFYLEEGGRLWFASEINAFRSVPGIVLEGDLEAVDIYMSRGYIPHPWTIYKQVRKLPPGTSLTWRGGTASLDRYWRATYPDRGQVQEVSEQEAIEELRELLIEATRIRMVSERPLGVFLSGGLDSAAVLAAAARSTSNRLSTFSLGFEGDQQSELEQARVVADYFGTVHHEVVVDPHVEEILPGLAAQFGEPFADATSLPTYLLAKSARESVVVALNGDGGDEAFAGYSTYQHFASLARWPTVPGRLGRVSETLAHWLPDGSSASDRLRRGVEVLSWNEPADRFGALTGTFSMSERERLYQPESGIAARSPGELFRDIWAESQNLDAVNRLLACDTNYYLPGALLPKVDITTMAVSLEARSPFLDQSLLAWANALTGELKRHGGTSKYVLKKAMEGWLPHSTIYQRKKGFHVPVDEWLRGPLAPMVNDLLLSSSATSVRYLRGPVVRQLVLDHQRTGLHGQKLWTLLMFELWLTADEGASFASISGELG